MIFFIFVKFFYLDPFFEVKYMPSGYSRNITLYRSEVIRNELNPTWKPFEISVSMLGGFDKSFDILVWDFDDDGGSFYCSIFSLFSFQVMI